MTTPMPRDLCQVGDDPQVGECRGVHEGQPSVLTLASGRGSAQVSTLKAAPSTHMYNMFLFNNLSRLPPPTRQKPLNLTDSTGTAASSLLSRGAFAKCCAHTFSLNPHSEPVAWVLRLAHCLQMGTPRLGEAVSLARSLTAKKLCPWQGKDSHPCLDCKPRPLTLVPCGLLECSWPPSEAWSQLNGSMHRRGTGAQRKGSLCW